MFLVTKDGKLEVVRTTSVDQVVSSLKTLGVKSSSWKKEISKLKTHGNHVYSGVNECVVTVRHVR